MKSVVEKLQYKYLKLQNTKKKQTVINTKKKTQKIQVNCTFKIVITSNVTYCVTKDSESTDSIY